MDSPHRRRTSSGGNYRSNGTQNELNDGETSGSGDRDRIAGPASLPKSMKFLHRIQTNSSVLALVADDQCVFAGLQGGRIQAWSLLSYELVLSIDAHEESVLSLYLPHERNLLFSSGGDRAVNVWSTRTFERLYSIHSYHDVGDLFSLVHSSRLNTIYCGAQNASIQWYTLEHHTASGLRDSDGNPLNRQHRFFDSTGPGGVQTPPQFLHSATSPALSHEGEILSFNRHQFKPFAHSGYVSCLLLLPGVTENNPQEEVLISGGGDGTVKLWHLESDGGNIREEDVLDNGEGNSVLSLVAEGGFLYCGLQGGKLNFWGIESRQLVRTVRPHDVDVLTINIIGDFIFSGGADGIIVKLNRQTDRIGTWKAHRGKLLASAVARPRNRSLFITGAGTKDTSIAFWDAKCEEPESESSQHTSNDKMIEDLGELLSFRTVSSKAQYAGDCYQAATFLRKLLSQFGAQTLLLNTGLEMNPIVFARFNGNLADSDRGTILFYGHYDVINAENHKKWETNPFILSPLNGYLYGRGVSDNKGPLLAAIYAVGDLVQTNKLSHDVVFLIEGEEESGSRGFVDAVRANKELFGEVNWILLSNSYWLDDNIPCLTFGLRGVIQITVQIESDHPDLHSGIDGSSLLDEPVKDLILLLGCLAGHEGKILIPGFYDSILPVTESENARYEALSKALREGHPEIEDTEFFTESLLQRWTQPSLTVHRVDVSGPRNSTTIPQSAKADISIRLVPNQDAKKTTRDLLLHLQNSFKSLHSKNHLNVKLKHSADPWLGDPDNEIFQTLEKAVKAAWLTSKTSTTRSYPIRPPQSPTSPTIPVLVSAKSKVPTSSTLTDASTSLSSKRSILSSHTPLYIREGGSIPAIRFLEKEFGASAAQFPCGQASDHAHLDNERLRLENLYMGREIFKTVFKDLPPRMSPS